MKEDSAKLCDIQACIATAKSCIKCAKCIPTCQMYGVYRDEVHNPRGILEIISIYKSNQDMEEGILFILDSCLACGNCTEHCPKDLKINEVIQNTKTYLRSNQI